MSIKEDKEVSMDTLRRVTTRFGIAQDISKSDQHEKRLEVQDELRNMMYYVGLYMTRRITDNKEREVAITKLEEALMWGGKAIFKEES